MPPSCSASNRFARQHAVHHPVAVDAQVHESRDDVQPDEAEQDPGQRRVQIADAAAERRALFNQARQWRHAEEIDRPALRGCLNPSAQRR